MYEVHRGVILLRSRQHGTTLVVSLVLILLASILALFAVNVGMFEQRVSGNDMRARVVQQTAEAALSQGVEYFRANLTQVDVNAVDAGGNALWRQCAANDTSFPCGAVEETYSFGNGTANCPATSGSGVGPAQPCPRRSTMYRFVGGTTDVNGDGSVDAMEKRMLPLDRRMATAGNGFPVQYGVGALLCMVKQPTSSTDPTACTSDTSKLSGVNVLTLVGTGSVPGEAAHTTLSMAFAPHTTINNPAGKPPMTASGAVNILGTMQLVTNPNAAGVGVPVSVWTRQSVTGHGTPNTCQMDEFIRFGAQNSKPPMYEGTKPPIITCDTCNCQNAYSLSTASGNTTAGGIDILYGPPGPVGGPDAQTAGFTNFAIRQNEFPCDLFQYVFGSPAWSDNSNPQDYFCETAILQDYTANGVSVKAGRADEAYLYANATKIIPIAANVAKVTSAQMATCAYLNSAATGLVWDQQACGVGSGSQVGTPDAPVLLVEDGATSIQGRLFGLLFVRSVNSPLDPVTGGDGDLTMNAGAAIYGSVVVQGQASRLNGTAAVVFNASVLGNLGKEAPFNPFAPVPGSWTDRFSYSY